MMRKQKAAFLEEASRIHRELTRNRIRIRELTKEAAEAEQSGDVATAERLNDTKRYYDKEAYAYEETWNTILRLGKCFSMTAEVINIGLE